jgi:hypothetical protein
MRHVIALWAREVRQLGIAVLELPVLFFSISAETTSANSLERLSPRLNR